MNYPELINRTRQEEVYGQSASKQSNFSINHHLIVRTAETLYYVGGVSL